MPIAYQIPIVTRRIITVFPRLAGGSPNSSAAGGTKSKNRNMNKWYN